MVEVDFPDGTEGHALLFDDGSAMAVIDIQLLCSLREVDVESYEAVMRIARRIVEGRGLTA